MKGSGAEAVDRPALRVVRGDPTAEELAALVGAVLVRTTAQPAAERPAASRWWRSGLPMATPRPGPGAWRACVLPR